LFYSMNQYLGITPSDRFLSAISISFDPMVMEIMMPLMFGSSVVFIDDFTKRDGKVLLKKAIEDKITVIMGTPSFWQIMIDSGWEKPLNIKILCGGEALTTTLAKQLIP